MLAKEVDVMKHRTEGERKRQSEAERKRDEGTEKQRKSQRDLDLELLAIRN